MGWRDRAGFRPGGYKKPPFHTYLNHLLVVEPIKLPMRLAHVPQDRRNQANGAMLLASRLLVLGLYLGTIVFAYAISLLFSGLAPSPVIPLLFPPPPILLACHLFLT